MTKTLLSRLTASVCMISASLALMLSAPQAFNVLAAHSCDTAMSSDGGGSGEGGHGAARAVITAAPANLANIAQMARRVNTAHRASILGSIMPTMMQQKRLRKIWNWLTTRVSNRNQ